MVETALTGDAVRLIGAALGSEAAEQKVRALCVGRDGRLSGPMLRDALVEGITSAGVDVIDVGMVPTPVLYFSTVELETGSGVEITGSHNPPEYNGLKIMLAGSTPHGEAIQALRSRIEAGKPGPCNDPRNRSQRRCDARLSGADPFNGEARPTDEDRGRCGNGVAARPRSRYTVRSLPSRRTLHRYRWDVSESPSGPGAPENLEDLTRALRETDAELGLAFDGDGIVSVW